MKQRLPLLFLSGMLAGGGLLAQGSGGTGGGLPASRSAYNVIKSVTGTVAEVSTQEGTLILVDEKTGQRWAFRTGEGTRFRADKAVFGKKKIDWSDVQVGQRVKVSFKGAARGGALNTADQVVEVKVKKPKA